MSTEINSIFDLLDNWKGLPDYQLERRADIYFAYFLPTILSKSNLLNIQNIKHVDIIPEFPIFKELLREPTDIEESRTETEHKKDNHSSKVDYAVFPQTGETIYFIELKTDLNSINNTQKTYLEKANHFTSKDIKKLFDTIICLGSNHKGSWKKYAYLLSKLSELQNPLIKQQTQSKLEFTYFERYNNIKVLYIQPTKFKNGNLLHDFDVIDYEEVINALPTDDIVASRFAASLSKWKAQ